MLVLMTRISIIYSKARKPDKMDELLTFCWKSHRIIWRFAASFFVLVCSRLLMMGYKLKYVLRRKRVSKLVSIKFHPTSGRIWNPNPHSPQPQSMFNWMEAMLETISELSMFPIFAVVDWKCLPLVAWHVQCRKLIFKFLLRVEITIQLESESISKNVWFRMNVSLESSHQRSSPAHFKSSITRWNCPLTGSSVKTSWI